MYSLGGPNIKKLFILCEINKQKDFTCEIRLIHHKLLFVKLRSKQTARPINGDQIKVAIRRRIGNLKNTHVGAHRSIPRQPYYCIYLVSI